MNEVKQFLQLDEDVLRWDLMVKKEDLKKKDCACFKDLPFIHDLSLLWSFDKRSEI
jgi:hypothetical protein